MLCGIVTDGAPAMVGSNISAVTKIKSELNEKSINTEDLCILHCIIHQQNLCAKSIKFNNVMTTVILGINFIKARALNHRQFQEYLSVIWRLTTKI